MRASRLCLTLVLGALYYSPMAAAQPECLVPLHQAGTPCRMELDGGRLSVSLTPDEIKEGRSELMAAADGRLPSNVQGGLLFDAQLIRRDDDSVPGQSIWTLKATHVLAELPGAFKDGQIQVVSPAPENGGTSFHEGQLYRVFSAKFNGRFYIWNGTVVPLH